jgi:hypothetical protein
MKIWDKTKGIISQDIPNCNLIGSHDAGFCHGLTHSKYFFNPFSSEIVLQR